MLLKRIYNHEAPASEWVERRRGCATCKGKGVVVSEDLHGVQPCADCTDGVIVDMIPPLKNVVIIHTGTHAEQNFSGGLVDAAISEGWMTITKGKIILHAQRQDGVDVDLNYTINRMPGRYCCHCGEKLPDDATGELARAHVKERHIGPSPDPENPAGYSMLNHYACTLDLKQHEWFRAATLTPMPTGPERPPGILERLFGGGG